MRKDFYLLRDHPPLKQGLRLLLVLPVRFELTTLRDHPPLKQGLRHWSFDCGAYRDVLRDHPPLKQGLRLFCGYYYVIF